jgi:hypothetical protein
VPVLYTGADLACALGETVFHDLDDDSSSPAEVFRADSFELGPHFGDCSAWYQEVIATSSGVEVYGGPEREQSAVGPVSLAAGSPTADRCREPRHRV